MSSFIFTDSKPVYPMLPVNQTEEEEEEEKEDSTVTIAPLLHRSITPCCRPLVQRIHLNYRDPRRVIHSTHNCSVIACVKILYDG